MPPVVAKITLTDAGSPEPRAPGHQGKQAFQVRVATMILFYCLRSGPSVG
jgi:hypothetical protein